MRSKTIRISMIAALAILMALCGCLMLSGSQCSAATETDADTEEEQVVNPLTGIAKGFDPKALKRRTVAIVVENHPDARPQWGLDDKKYSPDIVLEGEVEGGITRTLWFYADYKKMPKQVGPMRSARPPFIRFSELFDSIFIHWGLSHSKGSYIGANTIFRRHKVQHINGMEDRFHACGLFDRDGSRAVSSEHTGIIHPDKIPKALKVYGKRQKPKKYTTLHFAKEAGPVGPEKATKISLDYSARTDWETTKWKYNKKDKKYHCHDFENDFERDNLIVLFDKTNYITKENYQGGGGGSVTYCDYKMKKGTGKYISRGTARSIRWTASWRKKNLTLIDDDLTADLQNAANATMAGITAGEVTETTVQPVSIYLNPGKTWIGWASSNHGGKLKIS